LAQQSGDLPTIASCFDVPSIGYVGVLSYLWLPDLSRDYYYCFAYLGLLSEYYAPKATSISHFSEVVHHNCICVFNFL